MVDLQKIETFLAAAQNLNFSETAKQLHLSQPTVSHHIKTLEEDLGATLFERTGTGLRLTEAGRLLLPWARRLLHDSADLQSMMSSLHDAAGELRIACSTTAGKYVLPQLAARFRLRYPGIQVNIPACTPEQVSLNLLDGDAHIGVLSREVRDPSLEIQEFFRDRIILIAPARHPWAGRPSIEPSEILGEAVIMREPASGTRSVVLEELAKHDISLEDLERLHGSGQCRGHRAHRGRGLRHWIRLGIGGRLRIGTRQHPRCDRGWPQPPADHLHGEETT